MKTEAQIRAQWSRMSQDPVVLKLNSMIRAIEKGNPGDTRTIARLQRKKERRIFAILKPLK
jgi:hypothetical protein